MPPLRTEASTTSLPPRERVLAQQRMKAIKNGLPLPQVGTNRSKTKARVLPPTLAATRERRAVPEVAYIEKEDGYHIKQVVRRPATLEPTPQVPYLPCQEDIPLSDEESDNGTVTTVLDIAENALNIDNHFDIDANIGAGANANSQAGLAHPEDSDADADAEGEYDSEAKDHAGPSFPLTNHPFGLPPDYARPGNMPQNQSSNSGYVAEMVDFIGGASDEDMRVLFDGLDNFPANLPADLPTNFPSYLPGDPSASTSVFGGRMYTDVYPPNLQPYGSPHQHSHSGATDPWYSNQQSRPATPTNRSSELPATRHLPLSMPTQAPTPTSTVVTQQPSVSIAQVSHSAAQLVHNSRTGTPVSSLVRQATHSVPQGLPAQVRVQSQSPALPTSSPAPRVDFFTESPLLLRRPPLRRSLRLPSFLENNGYDGWSSNEEQTSAPVAPQDANTSPNESLPRNVTQARSRALRFFNVRLLPRQTSLSSLRIPTILELRANALREYGLGRRRNRTRQPSVNSSTRNRDRLSSAELTPSQRTVMAPAEMHVLKDVLWTNPWPEPERRAEYLLDAQRYATEITGISGDDVFIPEFLNTVWDKMSNDRGNLLSKIECMMEHEFGIAAGDKALIFKLMEKDSFLYPTLGREPSDYFCVGALGSALEIIMFKSAKVIGVVFMEELCKPDDTEKSARWHRKMHDRTACMGVPPGLLAFAATQMYWALEKLYMGTTVHFDQQHYRGVWDRYFRALIQLPHLGQLRVDMLDRLKEYYMVHWPAEEPDEDNESFPAW